MPSLTLQQAFALALQQYDACHLAEAEAFFRKVLAAQPDHAEAWRHLGLIAQQVGRHDLAQDLMRQAALFKTRETQKPPVEKPTGVAGVAQDIRISVAHPTCRPDLAPATRQLWLERAAQPERIEYVFGINEGDAETVEKLARHPHALSTRVPAGHSSAVANYNAAVAATRGPLIICAQDDIYPPPCWDDLIWDRMQPHLQAPKVLHVHDGFTNDQLMVVMCFTRKWLEKNGGHLLAPEYDGYFSDTEFSLRAYAAGDVIDGRDIQVSTTIIPFFTQRANDETYSRQHNSEAVARGQSIFRRRNPHLTLNTK